MNPFVVKVAVFQTGERLPMLCNRATGLPLFEPTLFSLTHLRGRNRSTSTIQQALRSIMVLYVVLDRLGVDLQARLREGRLLDLSEIEEFVRACKLPLKSNLQLERLNTSPKASQVIKLEKARVRSRNHLAAEEVDAGTAAIRVHYCCGYLDWCVTRQLLRFQRTDELFLGLKKRAEVAIKAFEERMPQRSRRAVMQQRQGLKEDALRRLMAVIVPTSPENPWRGKHTRERNYLIINWFLSLGVRRGELLGVRTSDINFQSNEVLIARRADDPKDPRRAQPNTKTNDRLLALDERLSALTQQYVLSTRKSLAGARRHQFLFVANGSGAPLTLGAINKIFIGLRAKCPELLEGLSPHVFRHTWNDHFSAMMDDQKVPAEVEQKIRSRLMGWSETSGTAATYTRRHVQKKAADVSLKLQNKLKVNYDREQ